MPFVYFCAHFYFTVCSHRIMTRGSEANFRNLYIYQKLLLLGNEEKESLCIGELSTNILWRTELQLSTLDNIWLSVQHLTEFMV